MNAQGAEMDIRGVLAPDEKDAYQRDGYVVPSFCFAGADLDKLQRLALQLVSDNPCVKGGIRRPHLDESASAQYSQRSADWLQIATQPKLLDIVERLAGPDLVLWTSTLFHKPPLETATPWHRDGQNYPIRPLANTTVWIAVFNVSRENGALRVLPGSHRSSRPGSYGADEPGIDGRLYPTEDEKETAVDIELQAGQMIVFDVATVHGSWPNLSSSGRAGYAIRFFPATSRYERDIAVGAARHRKLILVRGQDRACNIFDP
jgi:hypothetical protein